MYTKKESHNNLAISTALMTTSGLKLWNKLYDKNLRALQTVKQILAITLLQQILYNSTYKYIIMADMNDITKSL